MLEIKLTKLAVPSVAYTRFDDPSILSCLRLRKNSLSPFGSISNMFQGRSHVKKLISNIFFVSIKIRLFFKQTSPTA